MGTRAAAWQIGAVLVTALALRAGAATWWQARLDQRGVLFALGDSEGYWLLGHAIATGQPYQYGGPDSQIFRVPGFPLWLAPFTLLEPPARAVLWARLGGAVLGAGVVGLVLRIAWQLGGRRAGLLAGSWAAIDPTAIAASILVLSEMLFIPLMLLQLWSWWRCAQTVSEPSSVPWNWAFATGALSACAVLTRPSWIIYLPLMMAIWCVWNRASFRRHAMFSVMMAVAFAFVMTPWWIRNYRITERFVPTTLTVGASLYDGLSPIATGASDTGMEFMARFLVEQQAEDASDSTPLVSTLEYRLDRRMARAARDWALAHPVEVLRLAAVKVWRTWRPWPEAVELPGGLLRWFVAISTIIVLGSAAYRIIGRADDGWLVMLLVSPAWYFTLIHCVFVGSLRYRMPAMIALIPLAACAWQMLIRTSRSTVIR